MFRKLLKFAADQAVDTAFVVATQAYLFYGDKAVSWVVRDDLTPEALGTETMSADAFAQRVLEDLQRLGVVGITEVPPELAEAVHHSLADMADAEIADQMREAFLREHARTEVPYA